jgi:hypothetical protein
VVDGCLCRRSAAEDGGHPCVEMTLDVLLNLGPSLPMSNNAPVEVDDADGAIHGMNGPQDRKYNRVISSKRDDSRMVFSVESQRSQRIATNRIIPKSGKRSSMEKSLVAILYLFNSILIVVRSDRYITAIDDLQSRLEGVYFQWNIVATIES